jgi:hypothetical protein
MEVVHVKNQNMQKNFVEKLSVLRKSLAVRFPSMNVQNLTETMGRLGHYHYHKKQFILLGEERELYNFLIENSYNPYTVYRWLLLERLPEELRFMIKERRMSQRKAVSEGLKWRHETVESLGESIMAKGIRLIQRM